MYSLATGIREEIRDIEEGRMDKKDNPLKVLVNQVLIILHLSGWEMLRIST